MSDRKLRIIIIDDNPDIHQDFVQVLTPSQKPQLIEKVRDEFVDVSNPAIANIETDTNFLIPEFQFDTAMQGQEGVEKIKLALEMGNPYALAFVDIKMPPGWDGIETIQHMWKIDKDIQVVICTAYSDYTLEDTIQKLGARDNLLVLKRPFDDIAVRQLACALARKWLLARDVKNHSELLQRTVKEQTESLQHSLSLLRATIESSADGILALDINQKIINYNMQFVSMWAVPDAILAVNDGNLMLEYMIEQLKTPDDFLNQIKFHYKNNEESSVQILRLSSSKTLECYSHPHRLENVIVGRVWSFHDITEQSSLQEKLEFQASHDPLTNLPNRVLFYDRTEQAIANSARHGGSFAILFLDLDRFKLVNDSLSHQVGDELLQAVAARLQSLLRKVDTLARLGGDEFVMIIPELAQENSILNVAQKILTSLEQPFQISGRKLNISASIGISNYPVDGVNINTLLRHADLAMYLAKELGGNQFKFYTPVLSKKNQHRVTQESELRSALANNEFSLVYQPQLDINTNQCLSAEALIRWQHPKAGEILPLDFIPVAEESGLIIPIGEWVIHTVCKQINEWKKHGLPQIRIAVNVSRQQLKQTNFASTIKNILKEHKINPRFLEMEITENVIIAHPEVMRMIRELKAIGVNIVLDDFGIGSSSLNYLKQLHIDRLKIDRTFIQKILKTRSDEIIIEAIMTLAQSMNFKVVAEGVETQKQINFLKKQNCTEAQGYLLCKPLTPADIETFFKDNLAVQNGSKKSTSRVNRKIKASDS